MPYGRVEDILSRDLSALNCHTNDDKGAWFSIDLGVYIIPTAYTLRHARGYGRSALRNWHFQMSKDGNTWTTLYTHSQVCMLKILVYSSVLRITQFLYISLNTKCHLLIVG